MSTILQFHSFRTHIITKGENVPAGTVLPSGKVIGWDNFLPIPGTGGYMRRDSLMHIVVYGILLRSSLKSTQSNKHTGKKKQKWVLEQ